MCAYRKTILAALLILGGATSASALPERTLRDSSGILYALDASGAWRPALRPLRVPILTAPVRDRAITLEEQRAFDRADRNVD